MPHKQKNSKAICRCSSPEAGRRVPSIGSSVRLPLSGTHSSTYMYG
jgi:hypothetical protein